MVAENPPDRRGSIRVAYLSVILFAFTASLVAFAVFFHQGVTHIYGDGLYHLNIARKMVDMPAGATLWQRYIQLGTPWLPLPHLLMLPFVWHDALWRSGVAGSLISMLSFIAATIAVFKLSLLFYASEKDGALWLALLSVGLFALNPNALYMQTTPMTELLFMALLVLSLYVFQTWVFHQTPRKLVLVGVLMTLMALTRYEGWAVLPLAGGLVLVLSNRPGWQKLKDGFLWGGVALSGPVYWLWHNWAIYGAPWEFYLGPYSARAHLIEAWTEVLDRLSFFPGVTLLYAGLTAMVCLTPIVFFLAFAGVWIAALRRRKVLLSYGPTFLLLAPFAFLAYSLARGEVQISLFPSHFYNVRYGLLHLLAAAVFAPSAITLFQPSRQRLALVSLAGILLLQYGLIFQVGTDWIITFQEPWRNNVQSRPWQNRAALEAYLRDHPPTGVVLMHTADLGSSVPRGHLRFSQIIHEGTARWWEIDKEIPTDVSTVIMKAGDPVWRRWPQDPGFREEFGLVFAVGPSPSLQVWQRTGSE